MDFKIICTIGPGSENQEILDKLRNRGVNFFRINLSHTNEEELEEKVKLITSTGVPLIIDTEGSQIRSGNRKEIEMKEGSSIKVYNCNVDCSNTQIFLNPSNSVNSMKEGDLIFIDFNSVLLKVSDISNLSQKGFITCKVVIGGVIGGRKAVYIDSPTFSLPPFSAKDRFAIGIAKKYNVKHFTLSFMSSAQDVKEFKKIMPSGSKIYSKIESREGLKNFLDIAAESDGLLMDRGDLSHQIPLERIPLIQKYIIKKCIKLKKEVFIATNTLEQMSNSLKPNRAEVSDIINMILDGATGVALTKETAVGKYPVETVNMLSTLIQQVVFLGNPNQTKVFEAMEKKGYTGSKFIPRLITSPHGGLLINRYNPHYKIDPEINKVLVINEENLMDAEQIATGAFSPLDGFMSQKDLISVTNRMRLTNGIIWPLPITLEVKEEKIRELRKGDKVKLVYEKDKEIYGILEIKDIYQIDKIDYCRKIYGTTSLEHPGVKEIMDSSQWRIGGKITLIKRRKTENGVYELTPAQTRRLFVERGWSKVLAFHTRNVIHRSHEFIQMEGLKRSKCDGLLIHPVIGKKKSGDFDSEIIIKSYEKMIEDFYPQGKVIFCTWPSYSRYGGPREALFTAIVRKNFGCSHFVIGRDHTGVGDFYDSYASQKIFDKFDKEELGIVPVKFPAVFYSKKKKSYVEETDTDYHKEDKLHISGTEARKMLKEGKTPPDWFMRKEISKIILKKIKEGKKILIE